MQVVKSYSQIVLAFVFAKTADLAQLVKLRLSLLVVFSAVIGFLMAATGGVHLPTLMALAVGGFLVTGASNAINQILEKDYDKLMDRTADRPLPAGRMTVTEAVLYSGIMGVSGILLLSYYFNPLTGMLGAVALLSYSFIYTPMKRISPAAVWIGAIPGALPPLIGWVSLRGTLGEEALLLFSIQFLWQFPHFWAIAWVAHEDYKKAGFKLLPSNDGRGKTVALQTVAYTALLLPTGMLPFFLGMSGWLSLIIVAGCGLLFLTQALQLYRNLTEKAALRLMFGSFLYLPIVQLALILDKM